MRGYLDYTLPDEPVCANCGHRPEGFGTLLLHTSGEASITAEPMTPVWSGLPWRQGVRRGGKKESVVLSIEAPLKWKLGNFELSPSIAKKGVKAVTTPAMLAIDYVRVRKPSGGWDAQILALRGVSRHIQWQHIGRERFVQRVREEFKRQVGLSLPDLSDYVKLEMEIAYSRQNTT
jgi:hypothetical protein